MKFEQLLKFDSINYEMHLQVFIHLLKYRNCSAESIQLNVMKAFRFSSEHDALANAAQLIDISRVTVSSA